MADDESVSQFMAFTACQNTETANSYLEMSGGNVEMAVGLFMEHGGQSSSTSIPAGGGNSASASESNDTATNTNIPYSHEHDIRAPDPTRRERLVDFGGVGIGMDGSGGNSDNFFSASSLLHQAINISSTNGNTRGRNAFAFADPMEVDDSNNHEDDTIMTEDIREQINNAAAVAVLGSSSADNGSTNAHSSSSSSKRQNGAPSSLSAMFAPPTHILHRAGGFQGARNRAKDERKWLLVNVQADSDFACHALNRDVWRNDLVEALITSSFIFWQAMNDTGDGSTYTQRYGVNAFPHVAIIDPRTGRLMWKKEGWNMIDPMTSEQFAQIAADFCSQHSFDRPPVANPPGIRPNRPTKRPVEDLSEQEQLEKAIRESQGLDIDMDNYSDEDDHSTTNVHDDDDDDVDVVPPPSAKLKSDSTSRITTSVPIKFPPKKEKTFEEVILEMDIGEEPKENGARVQIRMPDGGKIVRKFKKEDTVKVIYAFVSQSNEEAKKGKSFEMKAGYPPKNLRSKVDATIDSCNLSGESITVRWE